jgi:hypothetical protein
VKFLAVFFAVSCAHADTTSLDIGVEESVLVVPVTEELTPHPVPETPLQKQRNDVYAASVQAGGLAFYLEDKAALKDGEIQEDWELPTPEVYKDEPWCHAPAAHGKHVPFVPDHPVVQIAGPQDTSASDDLIR